jgi:RNA polymerase II subunit A small phosphatase-like protein
VLIESQRYLLVFDLDETLNSCLRNASRARIVGPYLVYVRPYVAVLLEACFDAFEVAGWTSSIADDAGDVVRRVFPEPERLAFVWATDQSVLRYEEATGERAFTEPLRNCGGGGTSSGWWLWMTAQ